MHTAPDRVGRRDKIHQRCDGVDATEAFIKTGLPSVALLILLLLTWAALTARSSQKLGDSLEMFQGQAQDQEHRNGTKRNIKNILSQAVSVDR